MRVAFALLLLAAGALLLNCGGGEIAVPEQPSPVLATLEGTSVDFDQFLLAARARTSPGEFPRTGSGFETVRDRVLRDVLVEEVLLLEAASRGITVSEAEMRQAEVTAAEGVQSEERLPELLAERYGSVEAWRDVVRRRLVCERTEAVVRELLVEGFEADEEMLAGGAERFAERLTRPHRLRARQVYAAEVERIRAAQADLAAGVPFVDLANKYNGDDGDMGWMTVAAAPPELVESTEGLAVGEFTEVVKSPLGYHLFQVLGRDSASELPEEEARAEIARLLRDEAAEEAWRRWLSQTFEVRRVEPIEDAIAEIRCCRVGLPYVPAQEES